MYCGTFSFIFSLSSWKFELSDFGNGHKTNSLLRVIDFIFRLNRNDTAQKWDDETRTSLKARGGGGAKLLSYNHTCKP